MKKKTIAILGSTGSIGQTTLDIIKKTNKFKVVLIIANTNYFKILSQIKIFKPKIVVINNFQVYLKIKKINTYKKIIFLNNTTNINKYIKKIDVTVSAIPGIAGLEPTITFTKLSKKILLANKEALVTSGAIFMAAVKASGAKLLPIDSEHNAIFQCLPSPVNESVPRKTLHLLLVHRSTMN